jgi:hypothetical protein
MRRAPSIAQRATEGGPSWSRASHRTVALRCTTQREECRADLSRHISKSNGGSHQAKAGKWRRISSISVRCPFARMSYKIASVAKPDLLRGVASSSPTHPQPRQP